MSQTSDTPRTDIAEKYVYGHIERKWVTSDFARQLERELNAAKERIAKLKRFASHGANCATFDYQPSPCTCGLSKLLEEIKP